MTDAGCMKFSCPNCGQHLEADADMAGDGFSCPSCGWTGNIPNQDKVYQEGATFTENVNLNPTMDNHRKEDSNPSPSPRIVVVKRPEGFIHKCRRRVKGVVIGVGILLLFAGFGVLFDDETGNVGSSSQPNERAEIPSPSSGNGRSGISSRPHAEPDSKRVCEPSPVIVSVKCLLDYLKLPTERRLNELSASLGKCPTDFQEAVKEYLLAITKTSEDMISDREREEMLKGKAFLGLLFGAVNQNDPQSGVAAGLQMGDVLCAEVEEKAKRRLRQEIEYKTGQLVDVAKKYGIDANALEEALLSR